MTDGREVAAEPGLVDEPGLAQPLRAIEARGVREGVAEPLRGTQSFVRVMQWCWRHPGVVALEVLWRWVYGAVALWLLGTQGTRVWQVVTQGTGDPAKLGVGNLTVTDPMGAAAKLAVAAGLVLPEVWRVVAWVGPLLLLVWLVVGTAGRVLVMRRVDRKLSARWGSVAVLQGLRVVGLGAALLLWYGLLQGAAAIAITGPLLRGGEPRLVLYFAMIVVGSLVLFLGWSVVSWVLSLAPLLAMAEDAGVGASLRAAWRSGPVRMKLVEINLVMGIVKVALLVLFLVFSACPLPFESVESAGFLFWWTVAVGVLWVLASDFFHVARQVATLELWRAFQPGDEGRY